MCFDPTTKWLGLTFSNGVVEVRCIGQQEPALRNHNAFVASEHTHIALSSRATRLGLSYYYGRRTEFWDGRMKEKLLSVSHRDRAYAVELSRDGRWGASAPEDREVKLCDLDEGQEVASFVGPQYAVYSLAFSRDGKRLAAGGSDVSVRGRGSSQLGSCCGLT
jgi:WD40 repeat protein